MAPPVVSVQSPWLLPSLIDARAELEPSIVWTEFPVLTTAYDAGFRAVNYRDFSNAVNGAAQWIETTLGGKSESHEVLAYIGPNDIRYMIFVVAAVKAGYVLLLISPRNSIAAQLNLFKLTGCRRILSTNPEPPVLSSFAPQAQLPILYVPAMEYFLDHQFPHFAFEKTFEDAKREPLVILHTSGSTGLPKPLIYTHEFAATYANLLQHPAPSGYYNAYELIRGNRMFFMFPPFHAAGILMHLFNAVFNRTTVIVPAAGVPPSAQGLADALDKVKADITFCVPTTCLELHQNSELLDRVSSRLEYLFYAGGDCPTAIGEKINAKLKFFTIIGYTECGSLPMIRKSGPWPRDGHQWKYVTINPDMNAEFRYSHEDLYEHWVVRRKEFEHIQTPFVLFPKLEEYTSKDLYSPHPTQPGLWLHRGRADDIIVFLNGEKTNPVSFEATICSHPDVNAALVIGSQRFQAALLVEPKTPVEKPTDRASFLESIWPVIEKANLDCPAHAKVLRSHVLFTKSSTPMLRAGKGTVQRTSTLALYKANIEKLYRDADEQTPVLSTDIKDLSALSADALRAIIKEHVCKVTGKSDVDGDDDFFALGMDSFQVLQLTRELKTSIDCAGLAPSIIYTSRTIRSLTTALQNLAQLAHQSQSAQRAALEKSIEETYKVHSQALDGMIKELTVDEPRKQDSSNARTILLTGSTGTIGSYLLRALVRVPTVRHVYCLNRSVDSAQLQDQRDQARGLPKLQSASVTYITGDLSNASFGLSPDIFATLTTEVTDIIHAAWPVNFNLPLASFDSQLAGVARLAEFSARANQAPQICFISSVSAVHGILGSDKIQHIQESIFREPSASGSTGYAASKHIAERLLAYASEQYGLKSTILRVGQVAGPSIESEGRLWAAQEWLPSLVISSATLGALPDSLGGVKRSHEPDEQVDWIPVDVLANVITDVAGIDSPQPGPDDAPISGNEVQVQSKVLHLVNPNRASWSDLLPSLQARLSSQTGKAVEIASYPEWVEKLRMAGQHSNASDQISQLPALKLFDFYQSLLQTSLAETVFDTTLASRHSKTLSTMGPIKVGQMEAWVDVWMKL